MRLFLVTILMIFNSGVAYAAPWSTSGVKIPETVLSELKEAKPTVESDSDLEELIEKISSFYPSAKITPNFDGVKWVLTVKKNLIIASISAKALTNNLSRTIEKSVRDYRGQIYNKTNTSIIKKSALEALEANGFPNASISIETTIDQHRTELVLNVANGAKCTISGVRYPFTTPKEVNLPAVIGRICNKNKIISYVSDVVTELKSNGYAFSNLSLSKIVYDDSKTKSEIILDGKLGSKIEYSFTTTDSTGPEAQKRILDLESRLLPKDYSPYSIKTEIIKVYRRLGFNSVNVDTKRTQDTENNIETYSFLITEGPKTKITDVTVLGANLFTESEVRGILRTSMTWGISIAIDLDDLEAGISELKNEYIKKGYWDVKIRDPRFTSDPATGNTSIVLYIEEGLPRTLEKIEVSGNSHFSDAQIYEFFKLPKNENLNRLKVIELEKNLSKKYYDAGYIYSRIRVSALSRNTRISKPTTVRISIEEGPRAKFGEIFVFGLSKSKKKVVDREILFESGENYNSQQIIETKKSLIRLGIFRSVSIEPMDKTVISEKGQIIDIAINLKEADAGLISFGPGYDIFKGYNYVIEASYKNLSGLARRISLRSAFSQDKQQEAVKNKMLLGTTLGLGFLEPYLFDTPLDGRLSLSYKAKATNFWKFSVISQEEASLNFGDNDRNIASLYTRQKINIEVGSDEQTALFLSSGETRIMSAGLKLQLDMRDNISWPTKGTYLSLESEKADYRITGNVRFNKINVTSNNYTNIAGTVVFALGLQYTSYYNIDRDQVEYGYNTIPASEALLAGGSEMVRGYNRQLGPYVRYFAKDDQGNDTIQQEEIIGGTTRFVTKAEIRFLVSQNSAISTFYDAGNSYMSSSEVDKYNTRFASQTNTTRIPTLEDNFINPPENLITKTSDFFSKVYTSAGMSYNYLTPLGSFRFGYAFPIKQPISENCKIQEEYCLERRPTGSSVFEKGRLDISIAAKF